MIRNITFMENEGETAKPVASEEVILRTRRVTVSPAEEYQIRSGEVRPISNELAAAILSFKGRAQIGNKGVLVERRDIGGRFVYFHEDSVVLNDFSSREKKLFYVINRLTPDILHLLDETGAYIESLPLRERPAVLDNEAQAREQSRNKTIVARAAQRLQQLHAEDTREALEDLATNSREMQRVVQTLPAAAAEGVQPVRSVQGEAAAAGSRRITEARANKASAIELGRAIAMNRRSIEPAPFIGESEDWTHLQSTPRQHQPQPEIEKW